MDRIEVQQTGGFPLESDTLTFMQSAYDAFNKLGYLAGNSIIVQGCVQNGNQISNGWVFVNGELMPFEGGTVGTYVRVVTTTEEREFENGESKAVYVQKKAIFGSPGIPWQVFQRPMNLWELTQAIQGINSVPKGVIMMWSGAINQIPNGYALCNGQNGTPDLRSKFVVGFNPDESDYNAIGKTGGLKSVTLTETQMPSHNHATAAGGAHTHQYADSYYLESLSGAGSAPSSNWPPGTQFEILGNTYKGPTDTDNDNDRILFRNRQTLGAGNHTHTIDNKGGGQAHENRPPYYTIAYIIKL